MENQLRESIQELFQKAEFKTNSVKEKTGLHCPSGCGKCCDNPKVETSPLDWFLQAESILKKDELEIVLDQIQNLPDDSPCLYYITDPNHPGIGRCGSYETRPMICRLFGYSAVRNKHGKLSAGVCKVHKESQPHETNRFRILAENSGDVPILSSSYTEFLGLKPNLSEQMPINQALLKALEILSRYPINPTEDPDSPFPEPTDEERDSTHRDSTCLPTAI